MALAVILEQQIIKWKNIGTYLFPMHLKTKTRL